MNADPSQKIRIACPQCGKQLMMLGAIVWFVLGLMGGVIFFYPPILLIIGLVSLIGGIAKLGKQ